MAEKSQKAAPARATRGEKKGGAAGQGRIPDEAKLAAVIATKANRPTDQAWRRGSIAPKISEPNAAANPADCQVADTCQEPRGAHDPFASAAPTRAWVAQKRQPHPAVPTTSIRRYSNHKRPSDERSEAPRVMEASVATRVAFAEIDDGSLPTAGH